MSHHRSTKLADASAIVGYNFTEPDWLWEALQAAGSPVWVVGSRRVPEGNKRLAGLGDRILSMVIVKNAVDDNISIGADPLAFPNLSDTTRVSLWYLNDFSLIGTPTGATNERIQMYATNERLAILCDSIGLTRCIMGNPAQGGMVSQRTKASTLEAVIAAVYKDGGFAAAEEVIEHIGII